MSLTKAFNALRKNGYFAKQNFMCCQTCGWAAIPEDIDKVVFYHNQDNDNKKQHKPFYISWSGDGNEICSILNKNGVVTEWDKNTNTRIKIISYDYQRKNR